MSGVVLGLLIVFALVGLMGWIAVRVWRVRRAWVRWPAGILAGLLTLAFAFLGALGLTGMYGLYRPRRVPPPPISATPTPERVERGRHLAVMVCAPCHSAGGELPLAGGKNLAEDTGLPLGEIYGANLTPGGRLGGWSDAEIFRMIRTGIARDERATLMATIGARRLSDEDILAIIAYLRSSPPVAGETPAFRPTILTAWFVGAGLMPLDTPAVIEPIVAPPKTSSADYGRYVFDYMSCADCHGAKLDGNVPPPNPPAPNIATLLRGLPKEGFIALMRKVPAKPTAMPWRATSQLDDEELRALYAHMSRLVGVSASR